MAGEVASAYVSLLPSAKGFGKSTERQIGPQMAGTAKRTGSRFGSIFARATATPMRSVVTGLGALFAAQKITGFLKDSIAEAREAQVVTARTENVIKSMGLSSKVSASQIASMAMSISNKTAVDDEAIQSGQNLLLTFGNVAKSAGQSNGIFAQTSQLMVDMSVAMGTDAKAAALQLGKALNDPLKGVTALTRSGVSFTQQQKDQIATLVESGKTIAAQKIILGEVQKQFGGAAAAMATPADRAKVAWANFQEQIGTLLLPVIDKLLSALSGSIIPAVSTFIAQIQSGTGVGGQFASAFGTLGTVLSTVGGFLKSNKEAVAAFLIVLGGFQIIRSITLGVIAFNAALAANPIGLVVIAIAALAAGLVYAYTHFETFRNVVDAVFGFLKTAVTTVIGFVKNHWQLIVSIIGGPLVAIGILVVKNWDKIKAATSAAWNGIKAVLSAVWKVISTVVKTEIAIVKTVVTTVWNAIKAVTSTVWNAIKSVVSTQINAAKAVVSTAIGAIKAAFGKIGDLVGKVRGWFGDIVQAIKTKFGEAVGAVSTVVDKVKSALSPLTTAFNAVKSAIDAVINAIKSIPTPHINIPNIPGVPGLATGGRVMTGTTYLVGERGPELFTSSRSGYIVPNHALADTSLRGRDSDLGPKLDKLSQQLAVLTRVSAAQGREFGREINGATANARRRSA